MKNELIKTKIDWFEIYTFKNDGIGQGIINGVLWEPHIINFLKNNLTPNDVFVDVGSNYGWHSIIASKLCKKVYSFEPQKKMYDVQVKSIIENKIQNIEIFNLGLGIVESESSLNPINYESDWVNIGDLSIGTGGEKIKIKPLDSFNIDKIDFIKIDVQGFEKFVLEGSVKSINNQKPTIIVELENFQLKKFGYQDSEIFDFFRKIDYEPFYLEYEYPSDHVFVHKSKLDIFYKKNKVKTFSQKNNLNNNILNGVKYKI